MTNGLRNHPGPTRIWSYADEQRWQRRHRLFWVGYWTFNACAVAAIAVIQFT